MAKNDGAVTLYSPSGEAYRTSSRTEITRLTALGYSERKSPARPAGGDKTDK